MKFLVDCRALLNLIVSSLVLTDREELTVVEDIPFGFSFREVVVHVTRGSKVLLTYEPVSSWPNFSKVVG